MKPIEGERKDEKGNQERVGKRTKSGVEEEKSREKE